MLSCDSSGTSDLKFWDWCVNSRNAGKKEGGKEGQPWGSWIKTNLFQNTELSAYWTLWHVDTSTLPTSVASGSCFWGQLCFPVFVIFRAWAWVTAQAIFFFFLILARILFQTSLWLWEPNKVTHWGRHWSSGSLRGEVGKAEVRKGGSRTWTASESQAQRGGTSVHITVVPWGSWRNVGSRKSKHTPQRSKHKWPQFLSIVVFQTSISYKCDLEQVT